MVMPEVPRPARLSKSLAGHFGLAVSEAGTLFGGARKELLCVLRWISHGQRAEQGSPLSVKERILTPS